MEKRDFKILIKDKKIFLREGKNELEIADCDSWEVEVLRSPGIHPTKSEETILRIKKIKDKMNISDENLNSLLDGIFPLVQKKEKEEEEKEIERLESLIDKFKKTEKEWLFSLCGEYEDCKRVIDTIKCSFYKIKNEIYFRVTFSDEYNNMFDHEMSDLEFLYMQIPVRFLSTENLSDSKIKEAIEEKKYRFKYEFSDYKERILEGIKKLK